MKSGQKIYMIGFFLISSIMIIGCGGTSSTEDESQGSNISYLQQNHSNYSDYGSSENPSPQKSVEAKSIDWTITALSNEDATKLVEHIKYMIGQLESGKNPRSFDKLFLMEAYMKVNHYYSTSVEKTGTTVIISKKANTSCAYDVISSHSDAVSGDFFGKGDINNDYSSIAEDILKSDSCVNEKSIIETYINERQTDR